MLAFLLLSSSDQSLQHSGSDAGQCFDGSRTGTVQPAVQTVFLFVKNPQSCWLGMMTAADFLSSVLHFCGSLAESLQLSPSGADCHGTAVVHLVYFLT
jgi:hypothetical protein